MSKNVVSIPKTVDVVEFDRPPGLPHTCSDADLIEAVKSSICGGTHKEIAELLHVPEFSAKYWMSSREWTVIKQAVYPQLKGLLHTELCGVRSKALHQLAKRVDEGDPQYNQLGECVGFRPVKARDLTFILMSTSEVIHDIELELGVITDEDKNISLADLQVALRAYARAGPADITGKSERLG